MDFFKGHWLVVLCFGVCLQRVAAAEVVFCSCFPLDLT